MQLGFISMKEFPTIIEGINHLDNNIYAFGTWSIHKIRGKEGKETWIGS